MMDIQLKNLSSGSTRKPQMLVVDDQPMNIRLVAEIFKGDWDIFMATGGEQAIAQCRAVVPDLVLLDLVMPGMDGYEVCRRLKAEALTQHIPIIFLSGRREEADEALGFELGGVDYVTKPFNQTILRARVHTHLLLKQQADALRSVALVDGLTGVPNRRKFDEALQASWLQGLREQSPLSVLMMDVDYFKRYNDGYGHQMGDDCLRNIARSINLLPRRPYDLFARYGGEEFVCLLSQTDRAGAQNLAIQVLEQVRSLQIPHAHSDVAEVVTLSIGVATVIPAVDGSPDALLAQADQQLYAAKHAGRARFSACG